MKAIDYLIIAVFLGCVLIAYIGYRIEAVLTGVVVITVASWRFWDRSREKQMIRSAAAGNGSADHPGDGDDDGGDAAGDD